MTRRKSDHEKNSLSGIFHLTLASEGVNVVVNGSERHFTDGTTFREGNPEGKLELVFRVASRPSREDFTRGVIFNGNGSNFSVNFNVDDGIVVVSS